MQVKIMGLRKYHNYSPKDMAKLIGKSERQYISKEQGYSDFNLTEMFTIAAHFKMKIDDIFLPPTSHHERKEG